MGEEQSQEKKGAFASMGILPKLLILIAVVIAALFFMRGFELTLSSIITNVLGISFAVFLLWLAYLGAVGFLARKTFSPTDSFMKKLERIADNSKPDNVKNLFLRGEDMRSFSKLGSISGLLFIPYLASVPELNEKGKHIFIMKRNKLGKIELNDEGKPIYIQKMKTMTEKDGDWLFFVKKGLIGAKMAVRCHFKSVSPLGEDIWIKDVNVVPIGDFYYPSKQWQSDILRIQAQHQAEAIIETHSHFLDLVSTITETTLSADPHFLKIQQLNNETISNRQGNMFDRNQ